MRSIIWYYNRAKSISLREWGFRINQQLKNFKEKHGLFNIPQPKYLGLDKNTVGLENKSSLHEVPFSYTYYFFNTSIRLDVPVDFHFDPTSGKRFPLDYSKGINIRSDKHGSAKVVWEINRLQFLIPNLINYVRINDKKILDWFVNIISDWSKQNPYLMGVNWYSNIEINIRLINWYWCWILLENDHEWLTNKNYCEFRENIWLPLIYQHCVYSANNPSLFSSANNHLIAEYAGLFIANSLWKFSESEKWLTDAKNGLEKEIVLQHSRNGINKEEAAEYIQFITDFFLIAYVVGERHKNSFSKNYQNMLFNIFEYIFNFLDVKGNFPKYGDEDDGRLILPDGNYHTNNFKSILNTGSVLFKHIKWQQFPIYNDIKTLMLTAHLEQRATFEVTKVKNIKSSFFRDEGHFYFKSNTKDSKEIYAHFNAANLGFLSIAAHGHSDALSFSLNVNGIPFLVDPGTYTYHTHPEWRKYFVSTIAHNTVCIDNKNQAQLAGPTMWLKHYRTHVIKAEESKNIDFVKAVHNGYKSIGCNHIRSVEFDKNKQTFYILDQLELDSRVHEISQSWHLHPLIEVKNETNNTLLLTNAKENEKVKITFDNNLSFIKVRGQHEPILGWYSESFLKKEPTTTLQCKTISKGSKYIVLETLIEIL